MLRGSIARVAGYVKPGYLMVSYRTTGQGPLFTVSMGMESADALRVRQKPMPQIGSWGLVVFPYGDVRNGIWVCAITPSQLNAFTTTASGGSNANGTDPFIDYESHFSGHWWLRDGLGNYAEQWTDGSTLTVGYSGLPTVYRNITNSANVQQQIPFTRSDRIPKPPSTFPFTFTQAGSAMIWAVDVAGNVTLTTPLLTVNGNLTVSGNVSAGNGATGTFQSLTGQTITVQNGIVTNIF